jgi:ribonuclease HI
MISAELFTDGGARGNPGPAGIGCILKFKIQNSKCKIREYIGTATNNQAEYQALIAGLKLARTEGVEDLRVFMDSELIVQQLHGHYRVKNEGLKPLFAEVLKLTNKFKKISFHHLVREKNAEADKLVNEAIDENVKSHAGL